MSPASGIRGPPVVLLTYPHDERRILETQKASFRTSGKAVVAILYGLFLVFLSLFFLSYPFAETAALVIAVAALSTILVYVMVFRKR